MKKEEESSGESLDKVMCCRRLRLEECLCVASRVAEELRLLHSTNIIHRFIIPSNIIWNPGSDRLRLLGAGAELSPDDKGLAAHAAAKGSLWYVSPEQTGRLNRVVDYRTDFYSLGIVLYEMLTGRVPFEALDADEIVYCHIAREAIPPHIFDHTIPEAVSAIAAKLMEKSPEDRYQSASSIYTDLSLCLEQFRREGIIRVFPLGLSDANAKLLIPRKLYGRDQELQTLLSAFERVSAGGNELVLLAGYAGIGKTQLVEEFRRRIGEGRALSTAGKFDQYTRNIPYSAVTKAFAALLRQLLCEPEESLQRWREAMASALSAVGKVVADVVPELELIIGTQPETEDLDPVQRRNRFIMVFQRFIRVFTRPDHPLVIFLDDLQWVDLASLDLLKNITTDPENSHLLIIGAYRDNEVEPEHHLLQAVEDIRKGGGCVLDLKVGPITKQSIDNLLTDTFTADPAHVEFLGRLLLDKTVGNPFFLKQFLTTLYDARLIRFDEEQRAWAWSMNDIVAHEITDNVADLMINRLHTLSRETQMILNLAASIGNEFDLDTLSIISDKSPADVLQCLTDALESGYILPLETTYSRTGGEVSEKWGAQRRFKFMHDHVQQAAYSLVNPEAKIAVHAMIGRLMLKTYSAAEVEENIFQIVKQLNEGRALLSAEESISLAGMNLNAGRKAKTSAAYLQAWDNFKTGISLLPENCWKLNYRLAFDLYKECYECEYILTHFDEASSLFDNIITHVGNLLDKVVIYCIGIQQNSVQAKYDEAIEMGKSILKELGVELPDDHKLVEATRQEIESVKSSLGPRQVKEVFDLPLIDDAKTISLVKVLIALVAPTYFRNFHLFEYIVAKTVNIGLKEGVSAELTYAYGNFGLILCNLGDFHRGYEFGLLGLLQSEKLNASKCGTYNNMGLCVNHWTKHVKSSVDIARKGIQYGLEEGDIQFACYNHFGLLNAMIFQGVSLDNLLEEADQAIRFVRKNKNTLSEYCFTSIRQFALNLQGKTSGKYSFDEGSYNESEFLDKSKEIMMSLAYFHVYKLQSYYLFENYKDAHEMSVNARETIHQVGAFLTMVHYNFFHSLTLAALLTNTSEKESEIYWQALSANQKQLKLWSDHCPENYLNMYLLVEAEIARIKGNDLEAMDLYDKSIASAHAEGFIQNEAIAGELAARFWLGKGKKEFAGFYLEKAHYCYSHWGARAKTRDLEEKYPQLRDHSIRSAPAANLISSQLDACAVIKASQAISGEIEFQSLLNRIMIIMMENTGAQNGALILERNGGLRVVCEVKGLNEATVVTPDVPLESAVNVSPAIVNYAMRTGEIVVLDDAAADERFNADKYIKQAKPLSIAGIPVERKDKRLGVIYLENNLATGVFSKERLQVAGLLVAQVGTSLENARLFDETRVFAESLAEEISQRKLAEAAEQELRERLEQAARLESLGVLAGGVAHDLNNMLGPIIVLPDMVAEYVARHEDQSDPEYADTLESLRLMKDSALRATAVVSDLVIMSRRGQIQKEPLDLSKVVELMMDTKQIRAIQDQRPDVQITMQLSAETTGCMGSETRLIRVFANLVGNAAEAIELKGAVVIRTGRKVLEEPYHGYENVPAGVYLTTEVSDNGCGMTAQTVARIFEPFFSTKSPSERSGSGLGLSVVYGLVKDHDGFLDVQSEPGKGTTFTVYLPAVEMKAPAVSVTAMVADGNGRMLVVDDEPGLLLLSKRILKKLGYDVTVVSSGAEAVKLFEEAGRTAQSLEGAIGRTAPFDLVITDMVMDGLDGLALCRKLLQLCPGLKLIIASGYSAEENQHQAEAMGVDWLVKPYTAEDLARSVNARLDR